MRFPEFHRPVFPVLASVALAMPLLFATNTAKAITSLTVSVVDTPITGPTGSFDVIVTNNSGSSIGINDDVSRVFEDSVNPDVVFGTPAPTTDITALHSVGFYNHNGVIPNTASDVSAIYSSGTVDTIAPGESLGLMQVPVTILDGFTGAVLVDINTDVNTGTVLLNSAGDDYLAYTPVSGTLLVAAVPEPASLALLGLCALLLLRRRRRVA